MRTLTRREKVLLGTAAAVDMGFFCWNLILAPALEKRQEAQQQLWEFQEQAKKVSSGHQGDVRSFPEEVWQPEEADRFLQEEAEKWGMDIVSLQMGEALSGELKAGQSGAVLSKLPVKVEMNGPDLDSAARMTAEIAAAYTPMVVEQVEAEPGEEGVTVVMELGLYEIQQEGENGHGQENRGILPD